MFLLQLYFLEYILQNFPEVCWTLKANFEEGVPHLWGKFSPFRQLRQGKSFVAGRLCHYITAIVQTDRYRITIKIATKNSSVQNSPSDTCFEVCLISIEHHCMLIAGSAQS